MTPAGVRDGDPDALAALCERRGPAVLAYCEVVAGRGSAGAAAGAHAFGSFRAGVVATADLSTLNPEAMLISATRHAAARYASSDLPEPCGRVPALLAARADRSISLADHDWLGEHLAGCWTCRAPVARFEAADRAYLEPASTVLPAEIGVAMVAAMTAAAPVRADSEEPPAAAMDSPGPASPPNGNGPHVATAKAPETALPEHPGTAGIAPSADEYSAPASSGPAASGEVLGIAGHDGAAYELPATELPEVAVDELDEAGADAAYVAPPAPRERRPSRRTSLLSMLGLGGTPDPSAQPIDPAGTAEARSGRVTRRARSASAAGSRRSPIPGGSRDRPADDAEAHEHFTPDTEAPHTMLADEAPARPLLGAESRARHMRAGGSRDHTAPVAGARGASGVASLPRPRRLATPGGAARRGHGRLRATIVLPIALVILAVIVLLAIAGVFGGGEPASAPQSFAPDASEPTTSTTKAPVVVVPGAAAAAAAVERTKSRARAAKRRAAAAKKRAAAKQEQTATTADAPAPAAAPPAAPAAGGTAATPPPPPPPAPNSGTKPKIDTGGATGAESVPPAQDTSTVPDLAPPAQPATPPG